MKTILLKLLIIFTLTLSFVACSGGGGGGGSDTPLTILTITGASGNQVALDGRWSAGCKPDKDGDIVESVTTISGSSFSVTGSNWGDAGECLGTPIMAFSISGTFALGDEVTALLNGSPVTATKHADTVITALFTLYDADMVADANTNTMCGVTGWVAGTAKEVVGTECMSASSKDVMYIDDTVDPDLMYDGIDEEEGGALDAYGYPTVIETDSAEARLFDGSSPNIVSDTCSIQSTPGMCRSTVYNYSNGFISGVTSYVYVKNIGGAGMIDVAVSAGGYTEIKQFAVEANTRYELQSKIPATTPPGNESLDVTASLQDFSITKAIGPIYMPSYLYPYVDYYELLPSGPSSSLLIVPLPAVTVSGTVTLPNSVTDKQWRVAIDDDHDMYNGIITSVTGVVTGSTFNYSLVSTLDNLLSGDYFIYGEVDMSGNLGFWNAGDYVGEGCGTIDAPCKITVDSSKTVDFPLVVMIDEGSLAITGASGNQVALDGRWKSEKDLNADGDTVEIISTISGSTFSGATIIWNNTDKSTPPAMTGNISGTLALGDEVTALLNSFPLTATKMDYVVNTALYTYYDADWVADANTNAMCGATDWVVGIAKDVLGTDCVSTSVYKDIIHINDNAVDDYMLWGSHEDGTLDADGYPTKLLSIKEVRL